MSSQPQLEHYFSHLNMRRFQHQSELCLIADDASIPTEAQMRRALRGSTRGRGSSSLDHQSHHTPSCLKDSGKKRFMRWDASPSSSSLALSKASGDTSNNLRTSPSADSLLVLPQRRWKDKRQSTPNSDARSRSAGFPDGSKFHGMRNAQHNILFEASTKNWQPNSSFSEELIRPSLPSLNKSSPNLCQEGYLVSVLSSLAQSDDASALDGHNHTTNQSSQTNPATVIISRALDISLPP